MDYRTYQQLHSVESWVVPLSEQMMQVSWNMISPCPLC